MGDLLQKKSFKTQQENYDLAGDVSEPISFWGNAPAWPKKSRHHDVGAGFNNHPVVCIRELS